MSTKPTAAAMLTVFDGEQVIGFIMRRGPAGVEAFSAAEASLGLFETEGCRGKLDLETRARSGRGAMTFPPERFNILKVAEASEREILSKLVGGLAS